MRIKGTENNFEPVLCVHPKCADKAPHMHCPFCVKTEIYPDPVILKAHYRVKHVDKGLDFAGRQLTKYQGICVALLQYRAFAKSCARLSRFHLHRKRV